MCNAQGETWIELLTSFPAEILLFQFLRFQLEFHVTRFTSGTSTYTQVVWADTYKVGCGFTAFYGFDGSYKKLYVCNYGPGGNIIGGSMYKTGWPCTQCPVDAPSCRHYLCVWGSYVVFNAVTGFRPVHWAPPVCYHWHLANPHQFYGTIRYNKLWHVQLSYLTSEI